MVPVPYKVPNEENDSAYESYLSLFRPTSGGRCIHHAHFPSSSSLLRFVDSPASHPYVRAFKCVWGRGPRLRLFLLLRVSRSQELIQHLIHSSKTVLFFVKMLKNQTICKTDNPLEVSSLRSARSTSNVCGEMERSKRGRTNSNKLPAALLSKGQTKLEDPLSVECLLSLRGTLDRINLAI